MAYAQSIGRVIKMHVLPMNLAVRKLVNILLGT